MKEELSTIRLYGKLGTQFGRVYQLAVASPAEAIRALCVLLPGFRRHLIESERHGVKYAVFVGKRNLGRDELTAAAGRDEIRIAPVLQGAAKGGAFEAILGAVMVAISIWQPEFAGLTAAQWGTVGALGLSIGLSGLAQLLSPMPKASRNPSSAFSGTPSNAAQGYPVPVLYGDLYADVLMISGGIYAEDQS